MRSVLALALALSAAPAAAQLDLATTGCSATDPAFAYFDPFDQDVTFLALGDPQYGFQQNGHQPGNAAVIQAMNQAPDLVWPTIIAEDGVELTAAPLDNIRGVIVAGDLTHNNTISEWNAFAGAYGLCANETLDYPVYEGWGNHDVVTPTPWVPTAFSVGMPAIADYVALRNPYRPLIDAAAGGRDGHYRWSWRDLTFIQLNLEPTEMARGALSFLDAQLDIVGPDAPVIIVTHYGFGTWQNEPDQAEQDAYAAVIGDHNVVAHVHGHDHATSTYTWTNASAYDVPMFNLGSPVWGTVGHATGDDYVHFTAFRITAEHIIACDVRAAPTHPFVPEFTPAADGGWCRAVPR